MMITAISTRVAATDEIRVTLRRRASRS
jgi:hypothetical protein